MFDGANVHRGVGVGSVVVAAVGVACVVGVDCGVGVSCGMGVAEGCVVVGVGSKIWVRSMGLVHASSR